MLCYRPHGNVPLACDCFFCEIIASRISQNFMLPIKSYATLIRLRLSKNAVDRNGICEFLQPRYTF